MKGSILPNGSTSSSSSSSVSQACAACKHQRKRCTRECTFAPYFPSEETKKFHAVHKIFGVSNMSKILNNLASPEEKKIAVESLYWEAECRERDPVEGCLGEYKRLLRQFQTLQRRCDSVNKQLEILKRGYPQQQHINDLSQNGNNCSSVYFSENGCLYPNQVPTSMIQQTPYLQYYDPYGQGLTFETIGCPYNVRSGGEGIDNVRSRGGLGQEDHLENEKIDIKPTLVVDPQLTEINE